MLHGFLIGTSWQSTNASRTSRLSISIAAMSSGPWHDNRIASRGAILEVGVWRGGTGCLMAKAAPLKTVYLADTFSGVVNAGERDTRYVGGEHADTSEDLVRGFLSDAGVKNARLLKGMFPAETAHAVNEPIALLHVDVDVYQSAKDTVDWALPRIPTGGKIVFDDYGFFGCEGVTRLVNQLQGELDDFAFVHNLNGHAILVRTGES
jgi:O-methyltransferase